MLHFGSFDIRTDIFVLFVVIIVILLQMLLCFKAKKIYTRLIPIYLSSGLTIVFIVLGFLTEDWESFAFFLLAFLSAILLAGCGLAWGIWAIVKKIKK